MLEFGQYISFVVLVIVGMITDLHLSGKPMLRPVQATWPKYPERCFFSVTKSKVDFGTLAFGQDINFVALMITEKISDLHLHGKLVLRPVEATWVQVPGASFFFRN